MTEEPSSEPTVKNYSLREELTQNRGILRSPSGRFEQSDTGESCGVELAEREGFEPPIGLHLCRISSAVHSTTLPPLLKAPNHGAGRAWSGRVLGEDGGPDKRTTDKIGGRNRSPARREAGTAIRKHRLAVPCRRCRSPKVLGFDGQHLRRRQASDGTDGDNTNPV